MNTTTNANDWREEPTAVDHACWVSAKDMAYLQAEYGGRPVTFKEWLWYGIHWTQWIAAKNVARKSLTR